MSTISIITCYMEWHRAVHLAPATRGGRLLADNQSLPTLIPLTARLCSGDTKHWWHYPAGGQHMCPAPGAQWQWDIGDPTQCIIRQWSSNRSYFDNEILRHIPSYCPPISPQTLLTASVPARQFMLHSILKCIMNLYKRESLLSWYVFFYSSIILPTSIKHWSYFHGRWIFNQSGEGISVRISRSSCA